MTLPVTLKAETTQFEVLMAEFADRLAHAPEGVFEKLVCLRDVPGQLCRIDNDGAAASRTGELVVRLQPTDLFLELLQAMRAGDFNAQVINGCADRVLHGFSSDGCLNNSIEGSSPGESQGASGEHSTNNPARTL